MGKDEAVQFPCCPCGGGVYIALLRQLALLQKEKKKKKRRKSEGREVVIFNTLLFAFTRGGPVMCRGNLHGGQEVKLK